MRLAKFDAIIFDNDGVLVDSEIIHITVERELLNEIGLTYSHETYLSRFVGLSMPDFYAELERDHQSKFGRAFPPGFDAELFRPVWPRIEAELQPISGASELVSRFDGPTAVASSAPPDRLNRKLEITRLKSFFEPHIYSSHAVKKGKPAPDLFLYAAARLSVASSKCLVIEDSENGVRAGRAAGMTVIGFTGGLHADPKLGDRLRGAGADWVVSSHADLLG